MASSTFHIDGKKIVIPTTRVITPKTGKLRMCSACSAFESKTKKLLMCSACRDAWYCDRKCQLADRKDHKPSCALRQFHKEALTLDDSKLVSEIPEGSGPINTLEKPLLTDFAEEFHEFTSKFRFDLLEAYVLAHTMQPKQTTDVPQVLYNPAHFRSCARQCPQQSRRSPL
ncbi:hypothetical protein CERSUDRAFT_118841 [Gelatoporia subvermispora B]|uniref:MYND-type domain-containing protein n=1 Tax=Ceriporiopsis subvermispora (strain B) TaxID=914234 RepID=M2QJB1_CERS8|nr:hypothetical protein CERSUDRAFT_118841 [Gelatoporia subvermispora B]